MTDSVLECTRERSSSLFVIFVISHFGLDGPTLVLIAQVPRHCCPFYFLNDQNSK